MTYALVIFQNPLPDNQNEWQQWQNILNSLEDAKKNNEHIEKYHDNAWLLPLQNELHVFVRILCDSSSASIGHSILFFDKEPSFITSS